ncbi:MAG TPA: hypothetical protein VH134_09455 [Candidatus Dormibacteraeota bacterium]|nr:hypothetical protein [Candidatus Dormibacteraeota bacterium]
MIRRKFEHSDEHSSVSAAVNAAIAVNVGESDQVVVTTSHQPIVQRGRRTPTARPDTGHDHMEDDR